MNRFLFRCAAALLFPLLAACSFSLLPSTEYTEPKTFDLPSPVPFEGLPFIVEVDSFSNECSGRFKMVFREEGNRIEIDQYNRWALTPGAMLTRYLAARFAAPTGNQSRTHKPMFKLDGTVLNCELNKTKKEVDLMVHYFIIEPGDDEPMIMGTEDYSIPVNDTSAEAFADGMNKAAGKLADRIADILASEIKARASEAKAAPEMN